MWNWHPDRQIDQWKRLGIPEIDKKIDEGTEISKKIIIFQ